MKVNWRATIRIRERYHRRDCQSAEQPVEYAYQCVRLPEMVRSWSHSPDHSSLLLLLIVFLSQFRESYNCFRFFFFNGHTSAFANNLFSFTSQVIFTDTCVPHLQFSSWKQILDTHHSITGLTNLTPPFHHGTQEPYPRTKIPTNKGVGTKPFDP